MKKVLYMSFVIASLSVFETSNSMNLEETFTSMTRGGIKWDEIARQTINAEQRPLTPVVDVASAYGGGDSFDPKVVCKRALSGDRVAQYSLYRHIEHNDFIALMLLAISAYFGKFTDSLEALDNLGISLQQGSTITIIAKKIGNFIGVYE